MFLKHTRLHEQNVRYILKPKLKALGQSAHLSFFYVNARRHWQYIFVVLGVRCTAHTSECDLPSKHIYMPKSIFSLGGDTTQWPELGKEAIII